MVAQWVVANRAPGSRRAGGLATPVVTPAACGATDAFLVRFDLAPTETMTEHYHPYSDEHLTVTSGDLTVLLEGEEVTVATGEGLLLRRGCRHSFVNRGDRDVVAVASLAPLAPRPELGHVDTEPVPNPDQAPPRVGTAL